MPGQVPNYDELIEMAEEDRPWVALRTARPEDTDISPHLFSVHYLPAAEVALKALVEDPTEPLAEGSALEQLSTAIFVEGYGLAMRRMGKLLGIDPDLFATFVQDYDGDKLSDELQARLRKAEVVRNQRDDVEVPSELYDL
jgi:hypothetical protein